MESHFKYKQKRKTVSLQFRHSLIPVQWPQVDWDLTTFSAQIGYVVPLISMLQLKSETSEKVDNVTCLEYIK